MSITLDLIWHINTRYKTNSIILEMPLIPWSVASDYMENLSSALVALTYTIQARVHPPFPLSFCSSVLSSCSSVKIFGLCLLLANWLAKERTNENLHFSIQCKACKQRKQNKYVLWLADFSIAWSRTAKLEVPTIAIGSFGVCYSLWTF